MKIKLLFFAVTSLLLLQSCGENKKETNVSNKDTKAIAETVFEDDEDLTPEQFKNELKKLLGSKKKWMIPTFSKLKENMTPNEVLALYPEFGKVDEYNNLEIILEDHSLIKSYKLFFLDGKLSSVTCEFHAYLEEKMFSSTSAIEVFENKWGELPEEEKKEKNRVWINSDFNTIQLSYMVDAMQLTISVPK